MSSRGHRAEQFDPVPPSQAVAELINMRASARVTRSVRMVDQSTHSTTDQSTQCQPAHHWATGTEGNSVCLGETWYLGETQVRREGAFGKIWEENTVYCYS
jgi:hypothetical protein